MQILESKTNIHFSEINTLTQSVGWGDCYFETEAKWQHVLDRSSYIAYARNAKGQLIAFGRILEDGVMCMFYDVCVHPDYQGQKIGNTLMNHLIDKIKDQNYVSLGLFVWQSNATAKTFYQKLGFEPSAAMELHRYMKQV